MLVFCSVAIMVIILVLYYLFPRVLVCGNSMTPTYLDSEILWSTRLFNRKDLKVGDVVVVRFNNKFPTEGERTVIKRIADIQGEYIYILGDNSGESYDSRYYGIVPISFVKCRLFDQRKIGEPNEKTA